MVPYLWRVASPKVISSLGIIISHLSFLLPHLCVTWRGTKVFLFEVLPQRNHAEENVMYFQTCQTGWNSPPSCASLYNTLIIPPWAIVVLILKLIMYRRSSMFSKCMHTSHASHTSCIDCSVLTSFDQQAHVVSLSVCSLTLQNVSSCPYKRCQEHEMLLLSPEGSLPSSHFRNQPNPLPTLKPETESPKLARYHPHVRSLQTDVRDFAWKSEDALRERFDKHLRCLIDILYICLCHLVNVETRW